MFRTAGEDTGRTPKYDAPPYDPSVWEGKDCAFISTLKDVYHDQQRMERQLRSEAIAQDLASRPLFSPSHTQRGSRSSTLWGRLLAKLFPRYYARKEMADMSFAYMNNDELVTRMHFALQTGDTELSALIARELARRRARIYEKEEEGNININGRSSGRVGDRFTMDSKPQSRFSGGDVRFSGSVPRRSTVFSADSSFVVPEVLLQQRTSVGGGTRFF
ncbi:uncharacterized protein TM35_000242670 [Trypanosoma theileri]|uniref:Uncharacterized protein n=1 Tax=Trypanosoma theileri TaxID=67003 RepID=A0A1X0NR06_9TRYP|nr:uncharacterized protein TM35_000242670 [Trypanosoma theileri]ORC87117.1 hypothetical protein TM35_000242670 [Trypanosoma theileri]